LRAISEGIQHKKKILPLGLLPNWDRSSVSWGKIHGAAAGERSKGSQPPSSSKSAYLPSAVAERKTRHEQNRTLALPYQYHGHMAG
jgi:hypothetical protein